MKKELLAAGVTAVATIALSQVVVNAEDVKTNPPNGNSEEKEVEAKSALEKAMVNVEAAKEKEVEAKDNLDEKKNEYDAAVKEKDDAEKALAEEKKSISDNVDKMHDEQRQKTEDAKAKLDEASQTNKDAQDKVTTLEKELKNKETEKTQAEKAYEDAKKSGGDVSQEADPAIQKQHDDSLEDLKKHQNDLETKESAYNALDEKDAAKLQKEIDAKTEETKQNQDKITTIDKMLNRPSIELWLSQDENVVKGDDYKNTYQLPTPDQCKGKPEYSLVSYTAVDDIKVDTFEGIDIDENGLITAKKIYPYLEDTYTAFNPEFHPQYWKGIVIVKWTDTDNQTHEDYYNLNVHDYDYADREKQYQKTLDTIIKDAKTTQEKIQAIVNYVAQEKIDEDNDWDYNPPRVDLYHLLALANISIEQRPEVTNLPDGLDKNSDYTNDLITYKNADGSEHGYIVDLLNRDENGNIRFEEISDISKDIQNTKITLDEDETASVPTYITYSGEKTDELRIPDGVKVLGYNESVLSQHHIDKVYIPASVKYIDYLNVYKGVGTYEVSKDNPYFKSVNGDVYTKDGTELLLAGDGKKELVVAEGTKTISSMVNLGKYESLSLPESLEDFDAVNSDVSLKMLVIPKNVKELIVSEFYHTSKLVVEGKDTEIIEGFERHSGMDVMTVYAPADSKIAKWAKTAESVKFIALTDQNKAEALASLPEVDSRILSDYDLDRTDSGPIYVDLDNIQKYKDYKTYLEEQIAKTNTEISNLKTNLQTINDYETAKQALTEAQNKYDAAKKALEANQNTLSKLEQEAKEAENAYNTALSELNKTQQEAKTTQSQYDNALTAYNQAKAKLDKATAITADDAINSSITDPDFTYLNSDLKKMNALRDAIIKANANLADKETSYKEAEKAYEAAKKAFDEASAKFSEEIEKSMARIKTETVVNNEKHQNDQNTNVTAKVKQDTIINSLNADDYKKVQEALSKDKDVKIEINYGIDADNVDDVALLLAYTNKEKDEVVDFFSLGIKIIAGDTIFNVHDLSKEVTYTLDLTHIDKTNKAFYVLRLHNNKIEKLPVIVTGNIGTFTSDKYSTYVLVSENKLVNTTTDKKTNTINTANAKLTVKQTYTKATKNTSTKAVETGDATELFSYISLAGISVLGMIKSKKKARQ